ncbi:MAG: hypothetical protein AB7F67_22730 [Rhodospirillaceae bacterium]
MARYLALVAATVIALAAAWIAAVYSGFAVSRLGAATSAAVVEAKEAYARAAPSPKILFAGGSSVTLGVRTAEIERRLGVPTVNFGLWITLPVAYQLQKVRAVAKPGDTVVLAFEYWSYTERSKDYLYYVLLHDRPYFDSLPLWKRLELVLAFPKSRMIERLAELAGTREPAAPAMPVNRNGDAADESFPPLNEGQRAFMAARRAFPHARRLAEVEGNWETFRRFVAWARDNRVTVLATFPGFLRFPEFDRPEERAFFDHVIAFWRSLDVPVLGTPQDFMVDRALIYDAEYHLNAEGIARRTEKLIALLAPRFATAPR